MSAAVEVKNISKTFGAQRALDDLSVSFDSGRVTALLGQNGSGKSTLIKILSGFYTPDPGHGQALVHGDALALPSNPRQVHAAGLRFLHQDLAVVPAMSVSDNFALTERFTGVVRGGFIAQRRQDARVSETLDRLGVPVRPSELMSDLAPAQQTMVAIARAFFEAERPTIFLDEPTASLPESEVQKVLAALRTAVDAGASIVYVSHRLDEVRQIADDLVILRDGRLVADTPNAGHTTKELVELVLGRTAPTSARGRSIKRREPVLVVDAVSGPRLQGISLEVGRGEILGVTGLIGCGRSELARILAGAQRPSTGALTLNDRPYAPTSPRAARRRGVGYVPQDRRAEGVVAGMTVAENASLSVLSRVTRAGLIQRGSERELADALIRRFGVVPHAPERLVGDLSGGNQQKVVFARNAALDLSVLVLDEPTQGIDIGARAEIADTCRDLAASGIAVIVASTDFDEIASLCDRVLVLDRGRIVDEVAGDDITVQRLTSSSFSTPSSDTPPGDLS
ncbi:monosaccharide ABC transporter ATP-binding protein (CUT2 family) [Microbacterium sp. AG1240]|uniref:sugar ABC transporter ATP-binding protein n=1 Tax=Microbacterium sp. AG1240 TaxID=2183992 RepID=UPI000EB074C2|nr:sugar ABC transporter ATP-binding protein [Microbacterium sp. AG1240]RKT31465.1 monosaccharide ABC transporter ATP-binding protein (CUT2 family) [Microbacterium sp. AG1240]